MTNQEKITAITNKVCELLKGCELDPMELKVGCYIRDIWDDEDMCVVGLNERYLYACNAQGQSRIPLPLSSMSDVTVVGID